MPALEGAAREVKMKRAIQTAMVAAAVAAAVAFLAPSTAQAQVRFEGRFRLPHGEIAVGVGDPYAPVYYGSPHYPVGSYVPYGYRVIRRSRLGHGFYSPSFACRSHRVYHSHWVPVRWHRSRWVVVDRPVVVGRYVQRGDPYYDFNRQYWDRSYRNPYRRPYR
jgi:hypothetical protein